MKCVSLAALLMCLFTLPACGDEIVCGECVGGHSGLLPYSIQHPWMHGQHKRQSAYSGYGSFRPYNYRHVAPQAQIATRWGATPGIPYSVGVFSRHHGRLQDSQLRMPGQVRRHDNPANAATPEQKLSRNDGLLKPIPSVGSSLPPKYVYPR